MQSSSHFRDEMGAGGGAACDPHMDLGSSRGLGEHDGGTTSVSPHWASQIDFPVSEHSCRWDFNLQC